jgi:hypothetical protein
MLTNLVLRSLPSPRNWKSGSYHLCNAAKTGGQTMDEARQAKDRFEMRSWIIRHSAVMPGLVPGIHVDPRIGPSKTQAHVVTWMAGTSPAMTETEPISISETDS